MTHSRFVVFLAALTFLWTFCGSAGAQKGGISSTHSKARLLSLNFKNNGQHVAARVGQQIEIRLGLVGPRQYGDPLVSSPAVQYESMAIDWPVNPGGATHIYMFEAEAEGEAKITVPVMNCGGGPPCTDDLIFTVTIRVGPAAGNVAGLHPSLIPDQVNTAHWMNAWTSLHNSLLQTFMPSRPILTGVEVELVLANPGPESSEVTLTIANAEGAGLAVVSKTVPAADCSHVLFLLPNGGLPVTPGQTYFIGLSSTDLLFGWKYVVGGYRNGAASMNGFNGKPLLRDARSTFLFRTFGES
jgi:hypothetical protein